MVHLVDDRAYQSQECTALLVGVGLLDIFDGD